MYRIVKVLNNNVAIVRDVSSQQAVVMGAGITYQKKKGDLISEKVVERIFTLRNEESQNNFSTLLKDIPLDFITASYEIIERAISQYQYPVQEYIYVTLTDHIYLSYQNLSKGTYESTVLPNIKTNYPIEFKIGQAAVLLIKEKLAIDFPEEEVSRIALHFINAKGTSTAVSTDDRIEKKMIELVQNELSISGISRTSKNQNYYDRLMIHLNYFLERIMSGVADSESFSLNFEETLKKDYPEAYQIGNRIYRLIEDHLGKTLNENERIYFTIHIQRLL